MATSTSCWPYLPSLKMVRSCRLRTMSWIYKESRGQTISGSISSQLLPTAPCPVWGNSLCPSGSLQTPCAACPTLAGVGPKQEQAGEGKSSSPWGPQQNNAEHGSGEMDG